MSEEAVHYVGTEVDTEADADDEDVHAGDLDGDAPPVHEAGHVQAGQEDAEHHEERSAPAAQDDEGGDEDADDGDTNIPQQFDAHYSVRLPVDVGEGDGKTGVTPGDLAHNPLDFSHGRDPVRGGVEPREEGREVSTQQNIKHLSPDSTLYECRGWLAGVHREQALRTPAQRRTRNLAGI